MAFCTEADFAVLKFMDGFNTPFLDFVLKLVSYMGNMGIVWILLGILMLSLRKTRKQGAFCVMAFLLAVLVGNVILKNAVDRVRPYDLFDWIQVRIVKPKDGSFPSGHCMSTFAFATALVFVYKKWGIAALVFGVFMAFSRLYFQVHFLTDVLAGVAVGILCGIAAYFIAKRIHWFDDMKWTIKTKRKPA